MNICSSCPEAARFRRALVATLDEFTNTYVQIPADSQVGRVIMDFLRSEAAETPRPLYAGTVDAAIMRLEAGESLWTIAEELGVSPSRLQAALSLRRRQMDAGDFRARHSPDNRRQ